VNERISEIADSVGLGIKHNGIVLTKNVDAAAAFEKFAQLIVRECLEIVNRKEYSYHEADPLWETAELIKEHFGVES
jgi:hypothetical protein